MIKRLVLTLGDPAGIGPEITAKTLANWPHELGVRPVVVGSYERLRRAASICKLELNVWRVQETELVAVGVDSDRRIPVIDDDTWPDVSTIPFGRLDASAGEAAWQYLLRAVEICRRREAEALVTAPINKQAFFLAGHGDAGHTEMLRDLLGAPWSTTLFATRNLRALFLTRHTSLREVIEALNKDAIVTAIERFASVSAAIGLPDPRIAVAALNPHAGEGGHFGTEERDVLEPAVESARRLGLNVTGPVPADSVFYLNAQGQFDVVLCLYHDQASAPLKAVDFHGTVSVTLGLPFLRFSVDHGTAFDIAGRGVAEAANLQAVVRYASEIVALKDGGRR
ncbi:MAG TPA: 4-hydroxythreonine-4-phosphate dehydrogenase PdxA [Acidimicrobiales bacterium]|nr:4-hydroxythreonine-4-phosphate dehydrogenase PdxA [Acidimicrobiales bacterium]